MYQGSEYERPVEVEVVVIGSERMEVEEIACSPRYFRSAKGIVDGKKRENRA